MTTLSTPPRRTQGKTLMWAASIAAAAFALAIAWSEIAAGVGLAVTVIAWLVPRPPANWPGDSHDSRNAPPPTID